MRLCTTAACWILFVLVPVTASALGLGNISLDSALNEPFSAEIPLQSVGSTDLTLLSVSLASGDTFERYDLDKPAFLNGFEFIVAKDTNGQPVIRVSSREAVAEPEVVRSGHLSGLDAPDVGSEAHDETKDDHFQFHTISS